ncbi:MAG: hypothetical protein ACP5QD_06775, partial [Candidatus Ratteibacteria bacterium]
MIIIDVCIDTVFPELKDQEKIEKVKRSKDKDFIRQKLKEKLQKNEITLDEYTNKIEEVSTNLVKEAEAP